MTNRLGTRRKVGRGRRTVVWWFHCDTCGRDLDVPAKRRPTGDPDDFPAVSCPNYAGREEHVLDVRGLYLLAIVDGRKVREEATAIRKQWDRYLAAQVRGWMCGCGHWRNQHRAEPPHGCRYCPCGEFTRPERRGSIEAGPDHEVPF